MRWKLLVAFGAGFTVVFVVVAIAILQFSVTTAESAVSETLRNLARGAAAGVDGDRFVEVARDVGAPSPGEPYPARIGNLSGTIATGESVYPTDERYWDHIGELLAVVAGDDRASPYSYVFTDSGSISFVGSWGARGFPTASDPPAGVLLGSVPSDFDIPPETVEYMLRSRDGLVELPGGYTDDFGTWVSAFAPIVDGSGEVVGGVGVDYRTRYVDEVRSDVMRVLYPVFGAAYLVLVTLVFALSSSLTKRISRLSLATRQVANGDYEVDLGAAARSRFADEMTELADAFRVMTERVSSRERNLARQVAVLKVEIDQAKRAASVAEITESDFFTELTTKAGELRARIRGGDPSG